MNTDLIDLLVDPRTKTALRLTSAEKRGNRVWSGQLVAEDGTAYPIVRGVPRFVDQSMYDGVRSFGDQWNHFNFDEFKQNWLDHTVANSFGSTDYFAGKTIVDAGGGSGAQSLWMLESGAERVILLELSHSVDDVVRRNIDFDKWANFDAIQCSIDAPPIRPNAIRGLVICHNVIQHTPSVDQTAEKLFEIVAPDGVFAFNCYKDNRRNGFSRFRTVFIYQPLRAFFSRAPFGVLRAYSHAMGFLRTIPILGYTLNKLRFSLTGRLPKVEGESWWVRRKRLYQQTVINTFDMFGSHAHQHHKTDDEIMRLVDRLQPDRHLVENFDKYFEKPQPTGCALLVHKN